MFDSTPLVMVDDRPGLERLVERLSAAPVIGVDTEADSFFSYQEKVCLLQFSDLTTDYIVDPLRVREHMGVLAPIFANPNIVKVFHGGDYDVVSLKRDFQFEIVNLFDTQIAAQLLAYKGLGLADLIRRFFGHEIEKKYQRHDWSLRPLEPEHLDYARGDTHFLLALRELLNIKLARARRLDHCREECAHLAEREWAGRAFDPDGYLRIKGASGLDDAGKRILRRLYLYRDDEARELDRPAFKVIADPILIDIAKARPRSNGALADLLPRQQGLRRRFGAGLLAAVEIGLRDDFAIPSASSAARKKRPEPEEVGPARLTGRAAERVLGELKNWRNQLVAGRTDITAFHVASNNTLKGIARMRPTSIDELKQVPDVREWQIRDYGEQILALLDRIAPMAPAKSERKGRRKR